MVKWCARVGNTASFDGMIFCESVAMPQIGLWEHWSQLNDQTYFFGQGVSTHLLLCSVLIYQCICKLHPSMYSYEHKEFQRNIHTKTAYIIFNWTIPTSGKILILTFLYFSLIKAITNDFYLNGKDEYNKMTKTYPLECNKSCWTTRILLQTIEINLYIESLHQHL